MKLNANKDMCLGKLLVCCTFSAMLMDKKQE